MDRSADNSPETKSDPEESPDEYDHLRRGAHRDRGVSAHGLWKAARRNWILLVIGGAFLIYAAAIYEPSETVETQGTLEIGDCTDRPAEGVEYFQVNEVPCDQEHVLEVFALVDAQPADNDPFPGHEEAFSAYYQLCDAEFPEYLGTVSLSSEFSIYAVYPSKAGWDDGFTQGICLLGRFDAAGGFLPSVGSARASGN